MSRTAIVLTTLVVYKLILVGIGFVCQRRTHSDEDFFLGGRRLGSTIAAISAAASSSSAWTLLGVSGFAYASGLSALWLFPACVGGFLFNWYVLAPALGPRSREMGAITVTEVLAHGHRGAARRAIVGIASCIVLVSLGLYVAAQFNAAGKTFAETFPVLTMEESILIGGGVVLLYTLLGGFWAVSVTDTLQGMVMALTSLMLPIAIVVDCGGPSDFLIGIANVEQPGYLSLVGDRGLAAGVGFVAGLLGIGIGYPGQPHVVNRFMALDDRPGAMVRARRIAIAWAVVVYAGMIILGLGGRVLFGALHDGEVVFIRATNELFHPVVSGILLAAVLSAVMSTADSQLLVAASSVTRDLGLGGTDPTKMLRRSRWIVFLLALGAIVAAIAGSRRIFDKVLFAWTAMGAAFGPPLLAIVLRRRPLPAGRVVVTMLSGSLLAVFAYYFVRGDHKVVERVVTYAVAFLIVLMPGRRALTGS